MSKKYYEIWGSMTGDPELDGQLIETFDDKDQADAKCEELNDDPKNHPDLAYWVDEVDHKHDCYHNDPEMVEHGAPCTCDDPPSTHTEMCHEYWERGLDCQCIPEDVKQAIRNGANPEDVM
ncbi:MAG: hypothetical protein QNJ81_02145 [Acidimicrobiia bacterium]|nr:hypothetical protein [Acidimicrobiia bacterium]